MLNISRATCDGLEDCVLVEIPDRRSCSFSVPYQEQDDPGVDLRSFVRSYTRTPGITFDPPCGQSLGTFFDPTTRDPFSLESWVWTQVHQTSFNESDGKCVLSQDPPRDSLVAVFDLKNLGYDREVVFGRLDPQNQVFFSIANPRISWSRSTGVVIRIELNRNWIFPDCCDLPEGFVSGSSLFHLDEYESTCDIRDSGDYVAFNVLPTLTYSFNDTFDYWVFDIQPQNETCGKISLGNRISDPFEIGIHIPATRVQAATDAPTFPERRVLSENHGTKIVSGLVPSLFVLVFIVYFAYDYVIKNRKQKSRKTRS